MFKNNRWVATLTLIFVVSFSFSAKNLRYLNNLYTYLQNVEGAPTEFVHSETKTDQTRYFVKTLHPLEQQISISTATITITLQPGWNSVYLPIQPNATNTVQLFEGIPLLSVWAWNQQASILVPPNTDALQAGQSDWLTYFPTNTESSTLTNLFAINGGRSYLIQVNGSEPVNWVVTGQPMLPSTDWVADSYNLVGFHVDPNAAPTFESYFAAAKAHVGKPVYQLDPSGQWREIAALATEKIQPNRAYWIFSAGSSTFVGPLQVTLEQGRMLDFGKTLDEVTLRIRNESIITKQVTIGQWANESYLAYWGKEGDAERWLSFLGTFTIQPNQELALRVAVKRDKFSDISPTSHSSVLEISDEQGARLLLPVAVESLAANRSGLWVGTAILNQVNQPTDTSTPDTPKPTGSEFQFRLIVHVDATGQAKLLQQVTLMWKEGTERTDPQDSSKKIVEIPGKFVLVTRDDLLSSFAGAAVRDGKQVGRRISSAAFSFRDPVALAGDFGSGKLKSDAITIDYNDPLNPFKHTYHPNHDNLDYDFKTVLPEGKESFSIVREIELEFKPIDPDKLGSVGSGADQVGGSIERPFVVFTRTTCMSKALSNCNSSQP